MKYLYPDLTQIVYIFRDSEIRNHFMCGFSIDTLFAFNLAWKRSQFDAAK